MRVLGNSFEYIPTFIGVRNPDEGWNVLEGGVMEVVGLPFFGQEVASEHPSQTDDASTSIAGNTAVVSTAVGKTGEESEGANRRLMGDEPPLADTVNDTVSSVAGKSQKPDAAPRVLKDTDTNLSKRKAEDADMVDEPAPSRETQAILRGR